MRLLNASRIHKTMKRGTEVSKDNFCHKFESDRLAQLVEYRTTVREVAGSIPDQTNNQGFKDGTY